MKILVHDYAGHPFPVELSKELARRGHRVVHAYFAGDRGPKGDLTPDPAVGDRMAFCGLDIGREYSKTSLYRRRFNDVAYGKSISRLIRSVTPDVVLSGNAPTECQEAVAKACKLAGSAFVFWMQDFYSVAAASILGKRLGWLAVPISTFYEFLERRQLERADAVVTITEDFNSLIAQWITDERKIFTIYNWGPSSYLKPGPKDNEWSRQHGLHNSFNFLYSGTLGLKHNPAVLSDLAARMAGRANVVVASEGSGTAQLFGLKQELSLANLILLPLQDFKHLPELLATADVAVALLEQEAGVYSVPSKVLSYLCVARPVLLSAPAKNLAARIVNESRGGIVVPPGDVDAVLEAAEALFHRSELRQQMAQRGERFASENFAIESVADKFEVVFRSAIKRRHAGPSKLDAPPQS